MEEAADKVSLYNTRGGWVSRDMLASITDRRRYTWIVSVLALIGVWQAAAMLYGNTFIMPTPWMAISAFGKDAIDPWIHENLLLTIRRVMTGFGYALVIGVPIGYLMGYSMTAPPTVPRSYAYGIALVTIGVAAAAAPNRSAITSTW